MKVLFDGLTTVKKFDMFKDKWNRFLPNLKLDLEGSDQVIPCKVGSLCLLHPNTWNHKIIEQFFDEETVEAILKVPFSKFNREDSLIWNDSSTDIFSVKYAYFIARKLLGREQHVIDERRPA